MAFPSVTYSFTNNTAADATQVNTNFTDIINGTSDGTKDFNISALTVAGTATFNGNVLLGNASSDDIQFNGSLATSLPIKTQRTYDIGGVDVGLRILYLGMNSTHTIALQAPSSGASADYSLTLPPTTGSIYDVPYSSDAASTLLWKKDSALSINASGGTSGVTLTTSSTSVSVFTPSAAITIKLDNSFTAGRQMTIVNNGTAEITLTANDNSTIATVFRQTSYTCVTPSASPSTNTSWLGLTYLSSAWIAFTPTGSWSTNTTYQGAYRRDGSDLLVSIAITLSGAPTSAALTVNVPASLSVYQATDSMVITSTSRATSLGDIQLKDASATTFFWSGRVLYNNSSTVRFDYEDDGAGGLQSAAITQAAPFTFATGDEITAVFRIPINGWTQFKG